MKAFQYYQPTEICYGSGRLNEIGAIISRFGKRCLLVTTPECDVLSPLYARTKGLLAAADIAVAHFDGVVPNPTTDCITAGAELAKSHNADVVLGLGGGSSMDTAKAIAVEAANDLTAWDYLWYRETQPGEKTLPVVAVTTTSGTGSQVTQVAVLTNPLTRDKSAIYNPIIFPRVALIDPELMATVPRLVTAATGFDVFCHAFETYLHPGASPYTDMMALEAIRLVVKHLPTVVENGANVEGRAAMAWADTLGGLCIASAGVTLPHGACMAIGGMYPQVSHGEALAVFYPSFTRFTWASAPAQFATVGRIFDHSLAPFSDKEAAEKSCEVIDAFLKKIGLWKGLQEFQTPEEELPDLAMQCMVLPDYKSNPRVADKEEMLALVRDCYRR